MPTQYNNEDRIHAIVNSLSTYIELLKKWQQLNESEVRMISMHDCFEKFFTSIMLFIMFAYMMIATGKIFFMTRESSAEIMFYRSLLKDEMMCTLENIEGVYVSKPAYQFIVGMGIILIGELLLLFGTRAVNLHAKSRLEREQKEHDALLNDVVYRAREKYGKNKNDGIENVVSKNILHFSHKFPSKNPKNQSVINKILSDDMDDNRAVGLINN